MWRWFVCRLIFKTCPTPGKKNRTLCNPLCSFNLYELKWIPWNCGTICTETKAPDLSACVNLLILFKSKRLSYTVDSRAVLVHYTEPLCKRGISISLPIASLHCLAFSLRNVVPCLLCIWLFFPTVSLRLYACVYAFDLHMPNIGCFCVWFICICYNESKQPSVQKNAFTDPRSYEHCVWIHCVLLWF